MQRARALRVLSASLWRRGSTREALPHSLEALSITAADPTTIDHANVLLDHGMLHMFLRDHSTALSSLSTALDVFLQAGDLEQVAVANGNIGTVFRSMNKFDSALEYYERALGSANLIRDGRILAGLHGNVGTVLFYSARYQEALHHQSIALSIFEQHGAKTGAAGTLDGIASIYVALGQYASAIDAYDRALDLFTQAENILGVAIVLGNKGVALRKIMEIPGALEVYDRSLEIYETLGDKRGAGGVLGSIGNLYLDLHEDARAQDYFTRALSCFEDAGHESGVAVMLGNLGLVLKQVNDLVGAEDAYRRSIDMCERLHLSDHACRTRVNLGEIYQLQGRYDEALELYSTGVDALTELGIVHEVANTRARIGSIYLDERYVGRSLERAEEMLLLALDAAAGIDGRPAAINVYGMLSKVYRQTERWKECLESTERAHALQELLSGERSTQEAERLEHRRTLQNAERDRQVKLARYQEQERILNNILPSMIAERILHGSTMIADRFERVTVFFSDIVGFTPLSASIPPEQLVTALNTVFTVFDGLAREHGLEKIKTIGDAYMAVAGVPEVCEDHADRAAQFALDVLAAMPGIRERTGLAIDVRIGLHSGPAVAGVIGENKLAYDLWGDTVNIASRMESFGAAGHVHVSDSFAEELRAQYAGKGVDITRQNNPSSMLLLQRGEFDIKGKGRMATWFLQRA
ncbi:MAG: tetratricopeptide repeat protein [Bacteroidetes bacterium]|nr:tetratricopeptide repeat protein [Bacteroidota bacterium]